jgi:hypothetical protein
MWPVGFNSERDEAALEADRSLSLTRRVTSDERKLGCGQRHNRRTSVDLPVLPGITCTLPVL